MHRYILIGLLFVGTMLYAQEERYIDLDSAKALALEQNFSYQSAEAELAAAKWGQTGAFSAFLPNLSLGGTMLWMDPARAVQTGGQNLTLNKDMRSVSLDLSQPLFVGGKLYHAHKIAGLSREMAELNLQQARLELSSEVESRYYSALQMHDLLEIANTEYEQAQRNLELAGLKLESGQISRADYLRFQANLANKDIAVLQTETAYALALKDFANYLGSQETLLPQAVELAESEIDPFVNLDKEAVKRFANRAYTLAGSENISLKLLGNTVSMAQRAHKIAKGSFLPTLTLVGSRQYDENGIDRYEFEASNQLMLNLSVPILPQVGNYAASRKAYYEAQKASYQAKSAADGIHLGIDAAAINLISSARQVHTAQLSLDITQDLYDQLSERFRLNMISSLELMDAELMLSAARMAYSRAYYDFLNARLKLLKLLGTDDTAVLQTMLSR